MYVYAREAPIYFTVYILGFRVAGKYTDREKPNNRSTDQLKFQLAISYFSITR